MRLIAMLLIVVVAFPVFTGCRDSDAFTQIVYNQDSEEETDDDEMMDNDEENIEYPDEDIFSVTEVDDSESTRDYDNSIAQVGDGTTGTAKNVIYSADGSSFYTSNQARDSESTDESEGVDTALVEDSENTSDEEGDYGSSGSEDTSDSGSSDTGSDSELDDVDEDEVAATETNDDDESNVEIDPDDDVTEEIPTGTTAAAVGEIAVLVQMLGGDGALVATSDSFKTEMVSGISAAEIFSDELADDILYLGDIEGFSEMSTSMFDALVEAAPDVIFMTTDDYNDWTTYYGKLSSARRQAFAEAEIEIVKVMDLDEGTSSSDAGTSLLYDVELIGKTLGDRTEYGGQDAEALAEDYEDWYDNTLGSLGSKGQYSCYISSWDGEVTAKVKSSNVTFTETGMAIAKIGLYLASSFYMDAGGVTATNSQTRNAATKTAKLYYVMTLKSSALGFSASGGLSSSVNLIQQSLSGTSNNDCLLTEAYGVGYLGSESYPALLVAYKSIKTKIESSRSSGGLFSSSLTREYFELDTNVDTTTVESNDYDIYVVPYGVGNWAEGSAESPLFSAWVAYIFQGTYEEDDIIILMKSFYSQFYRYTLSDSEAKIILAGRQD